MRTVSLVFLAAFAGVVLVPLSAGDSLPAPVPIVGAWWTWVAPVTVVPDGSAVLWVADTKHTVTTADSLDDALAGVANDRSNSDADPDTFDVEINGGPLSETFRYEHTFAAPGEKPFFCRLHYTVGMVGKVVVAET